MSPSSPVHAQTLTCQVKGGVVPCPSVACPGDQVTFIGTTTALVGANLWVLPSGSCSSSTTPDSILLSQTPGAWQKCDHDNVDPGPSTPCLTSTLTVRVNTGMTSSLIMVGTRSLAGQNTIVNTTLIMVIGKNVTVLWLFQVVGSCLLRHHALYLITLTPLQYFCLPLP